MEILVKDWGSGGEAAEKFKFFQNLFYIVKIIYFKFYWLLAASGFKLRVQIKGGHIWILFKSYKIYV